MAVPLPLRYTTGRFFWWGRASFQFGRIDSIRLHGRVIQPAGYGHAAKVVSPVAELEMQAFSDYFKNE